ncbi:SDR family NAD(P)-dependent oxidoreductase [Candidatus Hadarchaeum sp.]|uniref:SDR family NAD(P)-dependent oxidoreductase n=1 Tax=Candidatus Hadarchaeum sp. TaxID=2883567 RepID=UPI003857CBB6
MEGGEKVTQEIKLNRERSEFIKLDVTRAEERQKIVGEITRKYGKINILVNNPGILILKIQRWLLKIKTKFWI